MSETECNMTVARDFFVCLFLFRAYLGFGVGYNEVLDDGLLSLDLTRRIGMIITIWEMRAGRLVLNQGEVGMLIFD